MTNENNWYNNLYLQSLIAHRNCNANILKAFLKQTKKSPEEFHCCVNQVANILATDGFFNAAKFLLETAQNPANKGANLQMYP